MGINSQTEDISKMETEYMEQMGDFLTEMAAMETDYTRRIEELKTHYAKRMGEFLREMPAAQSGQLKECFDREYQKAIWHLLAEQQIKQGLYNRIGAELKRCESLPKRKQPAPSTISPLIIRQGQLQGDLYKLEEKLKKAAADDAAKRSDELFCTLCPWV